MEVLKRIILRRVLLLLVYLFLRNRLIILRLLHHLSLFPVYRNRLIFSAKCKFQNLLWKVVFCLLVVVFWVYCFRFWFWRNRTNQILSYLIAVLCLKSILFPYFKFLFDYFKLHFLIYHHCLFSCIRFLFPLFLLEYYYSCKPKEFQ